MRESPRKLISNLLQDTTSIHHIHSRHCHVPRRTREPRISRANQFLFYSVYNFFLSFFFIIFLALISRPFARSRTADSVSCHVDRFFSNFLSMTNVYYVQLTARNKAIVDNRLRTRSVSLSKIWLKSWLLRLSCSITTRHRAII